MSLHIYIYILTSAAADFRGYQEYPIFLNVYQGCIKGVSRKAQGVVLHGFFLWGWRAPVVGFTLHLVFLWTQGCSGSGTTRAVQAQGTHTQSDMSPSILVYEDLIEHVGTFSVHMG